MAPFLQVISYSETNQKLWFKDTTHRRAKDRILPDQYVTVFQNKQVTCVEYSDLTEENEREIFQVRVFDESIFLLSHSQHHIAGAIRRGSDYSWYV